MSTQNQHTPVIPMYQTSREDLHLRPENLYALELAGLGDSHPTLLCLSDVPPSHSKSFPSSRFALVDHNSLGSQFSSSGNSNASVVAIVDHHQDEGQHHSASPREIIVPTGSCASLVANLIRETLTDANSIPPELANLLLTATVIDTQGLKVGSKAEPADRAAALFLSQSASSSLNLTPLSSIGEAGGEDAVHTTPGLEALNEALQGKKSDVSNLGTRDLLRRDYKEYTFVLSADQKHVQVGLASVPIGFHTWLAQAGAQSDNAFWRETAAWADERHLDALGVLTSFRDPDHINKKGKPKHRREQMWLVRTSGDGLGKLLFPSLEADAELELKHVEFDAFGVDGVEREGSFEEGWEVRVYKQKNADATRKVTAPVVKQIIEGNASGSGKDGKL
jgi:exopolyphosphatase